MIHANYLYTTLFCDCIEAVKRCEWFQKYPHKAWAPPSPLHLVIITSPFCKWGIYFMTYDPPSLGGYNFIVFIVDYFTKWENSMPTYNNTTAQFFFNHVITRFSVPKELVLDHAKHFENDKFKELSQHLVFSLEFCFSILPLAQQPGRSC